MSDLNIFNVEVVSDPASDRPQENGRSKDVANRDLNTEIQTAAQMQIIIIVLVKEIVTTSLSPDVNNNQFGQNR